MTIREMGPYLAVHTGSTMVVHIPGGLVADETRIDTFLADIALLHTLRGSWSSLPAAPSRSTVA